jgi:hypothetical protein
MAWSLLPTASVFCSILPGEYMRSVDISSISYSHEIFRAFFSLYTDRSRLLAFSFYSHLKITAPGSDFSLWHRLTPELVRILLVQNSVRYQYTTGVCCIFIPPEVVFLRNSKKLRNKFKYSTVPVVSGSGFVIMRDRKNETRSIRVHNTCYNIKLKRTDF